MPSIILVVADCEPDDALKIATKVATKLNYYLDYEDGVDLRLRKGNLFTSIMLGAFMLYADLKLYIEETKHGDTRLVLEWSSPWWTGIIGVNRTKNAANDYMNELEYRLDKAECEILDRRSY